MDIVTYALLKGKIDGVSNKVDSLVSGINFKGSVDTRDDLPSNPSNGDSYIINDEGVQVVYDGTNNKWVDYGKSTNYKAGHNIKIEDNVISALDCTIGRKFKTNASVGNLNAGFEVTEDMTLADLIYKILYKDPKSVKVYHGATNEPPTGLNGLIEEDVASIDLKNYIVHIDAGNTQTKEGQYITVAISDDYILEKWYVADFPVAMNDDIISFNKDGFNIYYLESPSYDVHLGGIDYELIFVEA